MYVKKPKPASQMPNSSSLGKRPTQLCILRAPLPVRFLVLSSQNVTGLNKLTLYMQYCIFTVMHNDKATLCIQFAFLY